MVLPRKRSERQGRPYALEPQESKAKAQVDWRGASRIMEDICQKKQWSCSSIWG